MSEPAHKSQDEFRTAVTMTVVWVAGLTMVVIFLALVAGLLLDKILNSKPIFTILLMVSSIPLTIYLTFRIVKKATGGLKQTAKMETTKEEPHRGEDN